MSSKSLAGGRAVMMRGLSWPVASAPHDETIIRIVHCHVLLLMVLRFVLRTGGDLPALGLLPKCCASQPPTRWNQTMNHAPTSSPPIAAMIARGRARSRGWDFSR